MLRRVYRIAGCTLNEIRIRPHLRAGRHLPLFRPTLWTIDEGGFIHAHLLLLQLYADQTTLIMIPCHATYALPIDLTSIHALDAQYILTLFIV